MTKIDLKIQPDKGVAIDRCAPSRGRGRPMSPEMRAHVDRFAAMNPGESFFVAGARSADVEFLRKPFIRHGLGVLIRQVECDEIHKTAGVRVWRLAGEYDEL